MIEEIVKKRFNGSNVFWKIILRRLTPETVEFMKQDIIKMLKEAVLEVGVGYCPKCKCPNNQTWCGCPVCER